MANNSLLNTPTLWVNKYLQSKLTNLTGIGVPFFPTTPSTIDDLTEQWIVVDDQRYGYSGVMATWDRLFRMNKKGFPHIKCEQLMYYFYGTTDGVTEKMVQVQEAVLRLLDRMDESAQEVNDWCSNRQVNLGTTTVEDLIDCQFYFHNFKVYQLEEVRDIIDFGTARTYGGNKIIIEFDYHSIGDISNPGWKPETPPAQKITI
jgi:hypothetical protein